MRRFTKRRRIQLSVVLIGLTWAFLQHLLSGIRHLMTDSRRGVRARRQQVFAILTVVGAILLTAALWAWLLGVRP